MTPYLYANPNRHAPVRANGIRFWGHPTRNSRVRLIVIHTAENTPDYVGEDGGAEAVARYQATGVTAANASSYHEIGDSDSYVTMLPPEATAFGARGANADGWHWSFATRAYLWPSKPDWWTDAALRIAARRCALRARQFGIPVRRLTRTQLAAGQAGFVAHGDVDPDRRSDPGAQFPWARFLDLVRDELAALDGGTPSRPAVPKEDIMASIADLRQVVRDLVPDLVRDAMRPLQVLNHQRTNEATRLAEAAATDAVRRLRAEVGMTPDAESDRIQVRYLRHGRAGKPYTLADAHGRLREAAARGEDSTPPTDPAHGYEADDSPPTPVP